MDVTYEPQDGDGQEWSFDPGRIRASEAEVIEKRFGENWEAFVGGVQSGNIRARRVLLWALLRRQHHTLRYEDVPDFYADELRVEFTVAELAELRERNLKADMPEAARERSLAAIDLEMSKAMERAESRGDAGKASSATSPITGGTSSPPS